MQQIHLTKLEVGVRRDARRVFGYPRGQQQVVIRLELPLCIERPLGHLPQVVHHTRAIASDYLRAANV